MSKVAVAILNWNGKKHLERFLHKIVQYSILQGASVHVIDNYSKDDSVPFIKEKFPEVDIISLNKNYGFAEGYNLGLKQIDSEYFVLLNSDVEVTENWIDPIIDYMDTNPDTAACMPKILSWHNRDSFEYAGAAGGYIDKYGYPFCRGRIIANIEKDNGQYDDERDIFWATGACMFVRAKTYFEAGGLDCDFFAHMEEIDLCWRFKNMNRRIVYIPEVTVYHVGGGTLPNNNPRKLFYNYRNNLMLLYKNLPEGKVLPIIFVRLCLDGMSAAVYILRFSFSFAFAVWKAHLAFYSKLLLLRKRRKDFREKYGLKSHKEVYNHSIVWNFYVRKIDRFNKLKFDK